MEPALPGVLSHRNTPSRRIFLRPFEPPPGGSREVQVGVEDELTFPEGVVDDAGHDDIADDEEEEVEEGALEFEVEVERGRVVGVEEGRSRGSGGGRRAMSTSDGGGGRVRDGEVGS